jgi:hypothetical protein
MSADRPAIAEPLRHSHSRGCNIFFSSRSPPIFAAFRYAAMFQLFSWLNISSGFSFADAATDISLLISYFSVISLIDAAIDIFTSLFRHFAASFQARASDIF